MLQMKLAKRNEKIKLWVLPRFLLVDYYDSFLNNFKKVFIFIIFIYT